MNTNEKEILKRGARWVLLLIGIFVLSSISFLLMNIPSNLSLFSGLFLLVMSWLLFYILAKREVNNIKK